jgi:DhnA family fructose-bisphosphate aldolase class Ia
VVDEEMNFGKLVRMNCIFSHPFGKLCSLAIDHFIACQETLPGDLRQIQQTISSIETGRPDTITMHEGLAANTWPHFAGRIPLIVQCMIARVDDTVFELLATPEDAVRLGSDAFASTAFVIGKSEAVHLRLAANCVCETERFELRVFCQIYPRNLNDVPRVSCKPEDISRAVRCAVDVSVDVVKTPYRGDLDTFTQIVADCPVPLVAAGEPQAMTLQSALAMMVDVIRSGACGATIGRIVRGIGQISAAINAFKEVIHRGKTVQEAIQAAGI